MRISLLASVIVASLISSGCYYSHLASGQLKLLWARQPIERILVDPKTPEDTRSLLHLVSRVREFATELGLEVGNQYTSYVEWPEDRIVTTLVRTRPPSVDAIPYWFPLVGHLPYKGYFDRDQAEAEAARLRERDDLDVCVSGVAAYSTLGWMDDPVTGPMLRNGPASLVETLLHELVHATAFVSGDVDFNESVAQFIGQEATMRFFSANRDRHDTTPMNSNSLDWPDAKKVRDSIADRRIIARTTIAFRDRLIELAESIHEQSDHASADHAVSARNQAEIEARAELAALPLQVIDPEKVSVAARLSNACLALRGTYTRDLPRHQQVLDTLDGDLEAMISRLRRVAEGELSPCDFYADESSTGLQCPISSTTPSVTSPRKTSRHASVSTSASWAPSISPPL